MEPSCRASPSATAYQSSLTRSEHFRRRPCRRSPWDAASFFSRISSISSARAGRRTRSWLRWRRFFRSTSRRLCPGANRLWSTACPARASWRGRRTSRPDLPGIISPLVCLAEPRLVPKQLHRSLAHAIPGLTYAETGKAVTAGYAALERFNRMARSASSEVLAQCAKSSRPCILILARPYHLDTGIGHEIEIDLQAYGYPILWAQYLPTDASLLDWLFGDDLRSGAIASPFDISDVWPSSYSGNTNEILWGAKVGARLPWVTCVVRLTSYECGMDQPTFTPVQQIVEGSGTLFFSFQDLDCTKPAGSVKIRIETIGHYLERHSPQIIRDKLARLPAPCPFSTSGVRAEEVGCV